MASKFRLRRIFRPFIKLLAKVLSKMGVNPNLATIIMLCFSIFSFFALVFFSNLFLFSIFVFLVGIFDGVDGAIARIKNRATTFGGFFDSILDRTSEFVIFFCSIVLLLEFYIIMGFFRYEINNYYFFFKFDNDKLFEG